VIICEIIVHLLVIVQINKRCTVHVLEICLEFINNDQLISYENSKKMSLHYSNIYLRNEKITDLLSKHNTYFLTLNSRFKIVDLIKRGSQKIRFPILLPPNNFT
jgi:hypothetical protein